MKSWEREVARYIAEGPEYDCERNMAGSHLYNCETLVMGRALHVAPEFAPYIRAVLVNLPSDVKEKLMELEVVFLAVEKSLHGLVLTLPSTLHAHPITAARFPNLHTHPGGKVVYFSPLLFESSPERIRFTIAHEIAHVVLGHTDDFSPNAQEIAKRQEQEADEQAERWGFERPSTVPAP